MEEVPLLEMRAVRKAYAGLVALDGVDLEVWPGEVLGLVGPNGAGKTTTVRILTGLLAADEGEVTIAGEDLAADPLEARRKLAFVPDGAPLYPELSLSQHLDLVRGLRPIDPNLNLDALLRGLSLAGREHEALAGFSRGMRQRAAILLALVTKAPLLVLDEPLTGLDAGGTLLVRELLRQWADRGGAVLYTSHLLDVVEKTCDRVAVLVAGRIIACGTLADLRRQAGHGGSLEQVFRALAQTADPAEQAREVLDALS